MELKDFIRDLLLLIIESLLYMEVILQLMNKLKANLKIHQNYS
jgi:hypothetical protein